MTRADAIKYVGHHVDDALSMDIKPITDKTILVGWQCGFEPMFVAVHSYLGSMVGHEEEAVELAGDALLELGWFPDVEPTQPDFVI